MRLVIQRVTKAEVQVSGQLVGVIKKGLAVLLGVTHTDSTEDVAYLVKKLLKLRIFSEEHGKMNLSIKDIGGEVMVVSQFTLFASVKKGTRPSFVEAASAAHAEHLYNEFKKEVIKEMGKVESGIFGADMKFTLENDGPVTLVLDSKNKG